MRRRRVRVRAEMPLRDGEQAVILLGDCLDRMAELPDASVDAVVCDPPYGLEFMGKEWDTLTRNLLQGGASAADQERLASYGSNYAGRRSRLPDLSKSLGIEGQRWHYAWAVESLRVLKPGGHLLAFGGTRTYHRLACAVEDAGFEIRDSLHWIYGSGFPKSHNVSKALGKKEAQVEDAKLWNGWGTALKPSHEPIVVARKELLGLVSENVTRFGTGALNVTGCMIGSTGGTRRSARATCASATGWENMRGHGVERLDQGRWPPNVLLSHLPECGPDDGKPCADGCVVAEMDKQSGVSAPDFFPCFRYEAKPSNAERNVGLDGMDPVARPQKYGNIQDGRTKTGRDYKRPPTRNIHPTVKPIALMSWLCRLVTPPDGIVLDPFLGSGTTIIGALAEDFRAIGVEMSEEYVEIARRRIVGADRWRNKVVVR